MSQFVIQGDTLSQIAHAIRVKRGLVDPLAPGKMPEEIMDIGDGILPVGTKAISDNGIFDVTEVAFVDVNVESNAAVGITARLAGSLYGRSYRFQVAPTQKTASAAMNQEV